MKKFSFKQQLFLLAIIIVVFISTMFFALIKNNEKFAKADRFINTVDFLSYQAGLPKNVEAILGTNKELKGHCIGNYAGCWNSLMSDVYKEGADYWTGSVGKWENIGTSTVHEIRTIVLTADGQNTQTGFTHDSINIQDIDNKGNVFGISNNNIYIYFKDGYMGHEKGWYDSLCFEYSSGSCVEVGGNEETKQLFVDNQNIVWALNKPGNIYYINRDNAPIYKRGSLGWTKISAPTSSIAIKDISNEGREVVFSTLFSSAVKFDEFFVSGNGYMVALASTSSLTSTAHAANTNVFYIYHNNKWQGGFIWHGELIDYSADTITEVTSIHTTLLKDRFFITDNGKFVAFDSKTAGDNDNVWILENLNSGWTRLPGPISTTEANTNVRKIGHLSVAHDGHIFGVLAHQAFPVNTFSSIFFDQLGSGGLPGPLIPDSKVIPGGTPVGGLQSPSLPPYSLIFAKNNQNSFWRNTEFAGRNLPNLASKSIKRFTTRSNGRMWVVSTSTTQSNINSIQTINMDLITPTSYGTWEEFQDNVNNINDVIVSENGRYMVGIERQTVTTLSDLNIYIRKEYEAVSFDEKEKYNFKNAYQAYQKTAQLQEQLFEIIPISTTTPIKSMREFNTYFGNLQATGNIGLEVYLKLYQNNNYLFASSTDVSNILKAIATTTDPTESSVVASRFQLKIDANKNYIVFEGVARVTGSTQVKQNLNINKDKLTFRLPLVANSVDNSTGEFALKYFSSDSDKLLFRIQHNMNNQDYTGRVCSECEGENENQIVFYDKHCARNLGGKNCPAVEQRTKAAQIQLDLSKYSVDNGEIVEDVYHYDRELFTSRRLFSIEDPYSSVENRNKIEEALENISTKVVDLKLYDAQDTATTTLITSSIILDLSGHGHDGKVMNLGLNSEGLTIATSTNFKGKERKNVVFSSYSYNANLLGNHSNKDVFIKHTKNLPATNYSFRLIFQAFPTNTSTIMKDLVIFDEEDGFSATTSRRRKRTRRVNNTFHVLRLNNKKLTFEEMQKEGGSEVEAHRTMKTMAESKYEYEDNKLYAVYISVIADEEIARNSGISTGTTMSIYSLDDDDNIPEEIATSSVTSTPADANYTVLGESFDGYINGFVMSVYSSCTNGILDAGEDGVDCGGQCSTVCQNCHDGEKNGTEIGIDCGGNCDRQCIATSTVVKYIIKLPKGDTCVKNYAYENNVDRKVKLSSHCSSVDNNSWYFNGDDNIYKLYTKSGSREGSIVNNNGLNPTIEFGGYSDTRDNFQLIPVGASDSNKWRIKTATTSSLYKNKYLTASTTASGTILAFEDLHDDDYIATHPGMHKYNVSQEWIFTPEHCYNGNQDAGETGIDCGGGCGSCVSKSCLDIKIKNNPASGVFMIDPDGAGPIIPFQTYCNMDDDGGGWTEFGNLANMPNSGDGFIETGGMNYGTLNIIKYSHNLNDFNSLVKNTFSIKIEYGNSEFSLIADNIQKFQDANIYGQERFKGAWGSGNIGLNTKVLNNYYMDYRLATNYTSYYIINFSSIGTNKESVICGFANSKYSTTSTGANWQSNCGDTVVTTEKMRYYFREETDNFCYDGIQNHGELGVDCGRGCRTCTAEELAHAQDRKITEQIVRVRNHFRILSEDSSTTTPSTTNMFSFDFNDTLVVPVEGITTNIISQNIENEKLYTYKSNGYTSVAVNDLDAKNFNIDRNDFKHMTVVYPEISEKNFEIQFGFKTSATATPIFSISDSNDKNSFSAAANLEVYLDENGYLNCNIWKDGPISEDSLTNLIIEHDYSDNSEHSVLLKRDARSGKIILAVDQIEHGSQVHQEIASTTVLTMYPVHRMQLGYSAIQKRYFIDGEMFDYYSKYFRGEISFFKLDIFPEAEPTCDDGFQNQGETSIDCGGVCGACVISKQSTSCFDIKTKNTSATDGIYTIDPDGEGPINPFQTYCDMATDTGGWTQFGYLTDRASSIPASQGVGSIDRGTPNTTGYSHKLNDFNSLADGGFSIMIQYGNNEYTEIVNNVQKNGNNIYVGLLNSVTIGEHGFIGSYATTTLDNHYLTYCATRGGCGNSGFDFMNLSTNGIYPSSNSGVPCGFYYGGWKSSCDGTTVNNQIMKYYFKESLVPIFQAFPVKGKKTFAQAQIACEEQNARLATFDELKEAVRRGLSWCSYSWLADGTVGYPMQDGANVGCGGPGAEVKGHYRPPADSLHETNCFPIAHSVTLSAKREIQSVVSTHDEDIVIRRNCADIKTNSPSSTDGTYTIDPDGTDSISPFQVYCDMTTDGGGWTLVSTQQPDGKLVSASSTLSVTNSFNSNQKYSQAIYNSLAVQGQYQVMVEENSGADKNAGLVMVYKLPQNKALRFDGGRVDIASIDWWTGSGYQTVTNNESGSSNWDGISVHGGAWGSLTSNRRCVKKEDFTVNGGNNGDYKLDHSNTHPHETHSGTTRCMENVANKGVSHWVREITLILRPTARMETQSVESTCDDGGECNDGNIRRSCVDIKTNSPSATDGPYTIDPDGEGPIDSFQTYCDMTTEGGGWTQFGYLTDRASSIPDSQGVGSIDHGVPNTAGYSHQLNDFSSLADGGFSIMIQYGNNEHTEIVNNVQKNGNNIYVGPLNSVAIGEHGFIGSYTSVKDGYYLTYCATRGGCGGSGYDFMNLSTNKIYPSSASAVPCGFYYGNWKSDCGTTTVNNQIMKYFIKEN